MDDREIQKIKEIIQSSNLNFLIGAGLSTPFLPLLNDIEQRLNKEKDESKKTIIYKEYFTKVVLPNFVFIDNNLTNNKDSNFQTVYKNYRVFFGLISSILLKRKNTILSKQANIFTTNIDLFIETALESLNLEYNDGFSGRLNSTFSLSNFKRSILKRSIHFENISEIPLFNVLKMHGSLSWHRQDNKILFSKLNHINKNLSDLSDQNFKEGYANISIVNPELKKVQESVIDLTYYELLRMYSSELEKENTVLFVMGFSMSDEHIREITIRAANSNPTLKIYIFCYRKQEVTKISEACLLDRLKYSNVELVTPADDEEGNSYDLKKINETFFQKILHDGINRIIDESK